VAAGGKGVMEKEEERIFSVSGNTMTITTTISEGRRGSYVASLGKSAMPSRREGLHADILCGVW